MGFLLGVSPRLCLEEKNADVQALWALNTSGDQSSPVYYNFAASCKASMSTAAGLTPPAFAVF